MDPFQSPFNIMRDLDSKMVKFFHSVLQREIKKRQTYERAVKEVLTAYGKETMIAEASDICFNSCSRRCAYVYRCCACTATVTAYHFMQLLKCNVMLLQKIFFSDNFNVCCLGGGPGTEIVAIAKILDGLVRSYCPTRRKPLLIKATIIDKDSGWSVTSENSVKNLPQLVDTSLVRCELNFIESNLAEPFTSQVTDALGEADVITLVRFLSAVHGSKYRDRMEQMLQEVLSGLKEGGTLFFLDCTCDVLFDAFRKTAESFPGGLSETYGPVTCDLYKMSLYSVAESIKLDASYFGGWLPPCTILSNVSAWSREAVPNRRGPKVAPPCDKESVLKEKMRHISKCLKFCFRKEDDFERECDFENNGMFSTKSKSKRIKEMFVT